MPLDHYDEHGNAVFIDAKDEFIENVWKKLAATTGEQPEAKTTMISLYQNVLQAVHMAFVEIKSAVAVLDAVQEGGLIDTLSVNVSETDKMATTWCGPAIGPIGGILRGEAARLRNKLAEANREQSQYVLPLVKAGWRVKRNGSGRLVVDAGVEQLLQPVDKAFMGKNMTRVFDESAMANELQEREKEREKEKEEEEVVLAVNKRALLLPAVRMPIEEPLLRKQLAHLSRWIFAKICAMVADSSADLYIINRSISSKTLRDAKGNSIDVELLLWSECESVVDDNSLVTTALFDADNLLNKLLCG